LLFLIKGKENKMRRINGILNYELPDDENMAAVATADFTNATANMVNITGLTIPLANQSSYEFEVLLTGTVTADANGATFQMAFSGTTTSIEAIIIAALTNAACIAERIAAIATPTTAVLTTASQSGGVMIKGIIVTGANAGNLTVACNHPAAGTTTIRIGSCIKTRKIE
jgi:hypothetical protein